MNFDTSLIKIGQQITKLWMFKKFNTADIGTTILNIKWGFKNFIIIKFCIVLSSNHLFF